METSRQSGLAGPAIALGGAIFVLLVGGWLMLAPFALGYQPSGADWTDATRIGFYTGLGVAVVAVITAATLIGQVAARLRAASVPVPAPAPPPDPAPGWEPATRPNPVASQPQASREAGGSTEGGVDADVNEVAEVLAPLVEALRQDILGSRRDAQHAPGGGATAAPYEQSSREDGRS